MLVSQFVRAYCISFSHLRVRFCVFVGRKAALPVTNSSITPADRPPDPALADRSCTDTENTKDREAALMDFEERLEADIEEKDTSACFCYMLVIPQPPWRAC